MITPTKGIAPQRALLTVGAQILRTLAEPATVSQAWARLSDWRAENGHTSPLPFWWFALAMDMLYALGLVDLEDDVVVRRVRDAPPPPR